MVSEFNTPLGTKVIFVKSMFCSKFSNIRHHTDPRKLDICHFFWKRSSTFFRFTSKMGNTDKSHFCIGILTKRGLISVIKSIVELR